MNAAFADNDRAGYTDLPRVVLVLDLAQEIAGAAAMLKLHPFGMVIRILYNISERASHEGDPTRPIEPPLEAARDCISLRARARVYARTRRDPYRINSARSAIRILPKAF